MKQKTIAELKQMRFVCVDKILRDGSNNILDSQTLNFLALKENEIYQIKVWTGNNNEHRWANAYFCVISDNPEEFKRESLLPEYFYHWLIIQPRETEAELSYLPANILKSVVKTLDDGQDDHSFIIALFLGALSHKMDKAEFNEFAAKLGRENEI